MAVIDGVTLGFAAGVEAGARVLLAMSGGVDSAVSAIMLQEAGFSVIGVTMKNFCYGDDDVPERSCCSVEAVQDARGVCERLGISHMVVDTEEVFGTEVVDDFVSEYAAARTPNPCVRCNTIVRFRTLYDCAARIGADYVATGHYARRFLAADGRHFLARAAYTPKDQSYFLSGLSHDDLSRAIFPLGDMDKPEVRMTAGAASLDVAEKPESQEVCFVPDGSLRGFLEGRVAMSKGAIERADGLVLGQHDGLQAYTVGQRRGLGVATGAPMYVVRLDADRNVLVVGGESELFERVLACRLIWLDGAIRGRVEGVSAQIRSRSAAARTERIDVDGGRASVRFAEAQRAIAPGQTVAFYCGDVVVGSGVIDERPSGEGRSGGVGQT